MTEKKFSDYSSEIVHFFSIDIPWLLEKAIKNRKNPNILDAGCGDGKLLHGLKCKGFLTDQKKIVGVDLSPTRIRRLKNSSSFTCHVSDITSMPFLKNNQFDLIINNQVIEHVPRQDLLLKELQRVLDKKGILYISSVIKKPYGWYFYRNNGKWVLDKTHVREYKNNREFLDILRQNGFQPIEIVNDNLWFSPLNMIIRKLNKKGIVRVSNNIYQKNRILRMLNHIRIPIIGYKKIHVLAKKS